MSTLISQSVPPLGGSSRGAVEKTSYFRAKSVNISQTVRDTPKVTTKTLHINMCSRLAPRSMTLDISSNFRRISRDFADLGGSNS